MTQPVQENWTLYERTVYKLETVVKHQKKKSGTVVRRGRGCTELFQKRTGQLGGIRQKGGPSQKQGLGERII